LKRRACACARLDKKIDQRFAAQRRYFFDLAGANLLKCIRCLENEIDFVGRQLAQAEQIFSCPARAHGFWVAHASRVLVSASRRNRLSRGVATSCVTKIKEKFAIAGTRLPTRGTRALPRRFAITLILFSAKRRPVRCRFLAGAPESVRASQSAGFFRRNRDESAAPDGRDRPVQRAECARDGRMN